MNMLVTLFGGVVLVVVIYQALRGLGFPNYWRGVISGVVPLVAFATYATKHWSGLDVLAIHTAVYLSTATILTMLGARPAEQKAERRTRMHWGPKAIIAFFLFVFVINGVFLYISSQGLPPSLAKWLLPNSENENLHTAFPGVVPHGQEAAKEIASELTARNRQMRLGWRVDITGLDALARDGAAQVAVRAHARDDAPMNDAQVSLDLLRPAQATSDFTLRLEPSVPGEYQAWVKVPEAGRWIAVLRVVRGGDEYRTEQQLTIQLKDHGGTRRPGT
jgi:nitrogen fixation protein FixH